jgi:hypothetical protein
MMHLWAKRKHFQVNFIGYDIATLKKNISSTFFKYDE